LPLSRRRSHADRSRVMSDNLSDFDFELPEELIAQEPSLQRSDAKLLIVRRNPKAGESRFQDLLVRELPEFVSKANEFKNSRWFRNRSKVFPARFYAKRASGSRHEIVLIEALESHNSQTHEWKALIRNSRRLSYPETLEVESDRFPNLKVRVVREGIIDLGPLGADPLKILENFGEMPLPPYIRNRNAERDRDRYQSVWAQSENLGSAAAPTASLHFDEKTLQKLNQSISFYDLVLHVGLGTFEALRHEALNDNRLHSEKILVPKTTAHALLDSRPPLNVAIGTTALRSMESFLLSRRGDPNVSLTIEKNGDYRGRTSIFIKPGYQFQGTDMLLTNFHLPKSSLFILLSTFAGSLQLAKEAYAHAVQKNYRFFSYGDASLWI
jgi:S-adenosylmethionine:tRNA ribosyltransferase-isomerase